jgi:hypothetical protein
MDTNKKWRVRIWANGRDIESRPFREEHIVTEQGVTAIGFRFVEGKKETYIHPSTVDRIEVEEI